MECLEDNATDEDGDSRSVEAKQEDTIKQWRMLPAWFVDAVKQKIDCLQSNDARNVAKDEKNAGGITPST